MTKSRASAFVYILQRALIGPSAPASPAGFDVYIVIKRGDKIKRSDWSKRACWILCLHCKQAWRRLLGVPVMTTMTLPDCK